jgi:serine/threonine protein phosphatase PrpC
MKLSGLPITYIGGKQGVYSDSTVLNETMRLYILSHGIEHAAGQWASKVVCEEIEKAVGQAIPELNQLESSDPKKARNRAARLLEEAFQVASKVIYAERSTKPQFQELAVATVAVLFLKDCAIVASIGNNRAYLLRDSDMISLTKDHTLYQDMLDSKKWSEGNINSSFKKRLTRGMGIESSLIVIARAVPLSPGDRFLCCTSGLSSLISERMDEIKTKLLKENGFKDVAALIPQLLAQQKSIENSTAIAITVPSEEGAQSGMIGEKDRLELLKSVPIFKSIKDSTDNLIKLSSLLNERVAKTGQAIVEQGAASDEMFIVMKGSAHVVRNKQKVADIKEKGVIGEIGFLTKKKRSATVIAAKDCQLLVLNQKDFYQLMHSDQELIVKFVFGIIEDLAEKVELGSENLANLQIKSKPAAAKA